VVEQPDDLAEGEDPQLDRAVELLTGAPTGAVSRARAA
jgi:hypothetical protein